MKNEYKNIIIIIYSNGNEGTINKVRERMGTYR